MCPGSGQDMLPMHLVQGHDWKHIRVHIRAAFAYAGRFVTKLQWLRRCHVALGPLPQTAATRKLKQTETWISFGMDDIDFEDL